MTSGSFGGQVQSTFQAEVLGGGYIYGDSDFSDNILHSSVITALYGTIIGSGLDWSPHTHHVIVWMGSTAPATRTTSRTTRSPRPTPKADRAAPASRPIRSAR